MPYTQTVQVPIVDADSVMTVGDESFDHIVERRQLAKVKIAALSKEVTDCDLQILAALTGASLQRVAWRDEYIVSYRKGAEPRRTIDREKLLELGVAPQIIEAATKVGKPGVAGIVIRKAADPEQEESAN